MKILTDKLFYVQAFVLVFYSLISAQELSLRPGLGEAAVTNLLGPPAEKTGDSEGVSRWRYGESMVLFTEGVVAGWSDNGELTPYVSGGNRVEAREKSYQERKAFLTELLQ